MYRVEKLLEKTDVWCFDLYQHNRANAEDRRDWLEDKGFKVRIIKDGKVIYETR